jgi:uncharacterized membrane protein YdfJ with MMPL/SSD domain
LIVAGITGGETGAQKHAKELTDELVHDRDGLTVRAGGEAMTAATSLKDGSAFLTVGSTAPLFSDTSEAQLDRLRAVSPPAGQQVQLTGVAQINRDSSTAVTSRLPTVLGAIAAITFVLLFLLTGSVVLPLKALCSTSYR